MSLLTFDLEFPTIPTIRTSRTDSPRRTRGPLPTIVRDAELNETIKDHMNPGIDLITDGETGMRKEVCLEYSLMMTGELRNFIETCTIYACSVNLLKTIFALLSLESLQPDYSILK